MNYIMRGLIELRYAFPIGILIYAAFFLLMYVLKKRKGISWKCVPELIFCIYGVLLIRLVGIFSLHYSFDGIISYNLIPFIGSSFVPVFLNFILFVPYGFLIPTIFTSCKWNWKRILCVGTVTSLIIELLQMVGGRYAEIDDFLINTLGTFTGYILYFCLWNFRKNAKKALCTLLVLTISLCVGFSGVYLIGDHSEQLLDGFFAVENSVSEIKIYYKGECQVIGMESDVYHRLSSQISNCGGHLLEIKENAGTEVLNKTDCFVEILFASPQNISFENADSFLISNADSVIYNCDKNILYWGNSDYQYNVDYAKLDDQLEEHRAEILAQYQELQESIIRYFE